MTAIPAKSALTGASVTEGEFKTALETLHDYLTGQLGSAGTQAAAQSALGALLGAGVATRSTAYTVDLTDRGRLIACTGTWTLTLPAAATAGAGFAVAVANVGTGFITIDPAGTETIGGQATGAVSPNACLIVACTGSAWVITGASSGRGMQVFTSSGTFVAPAGVTSVKVSVVGGGGNGGSATRTAGFGSTSGGGGGGGGVAIGIVSGSALTQSIAVTVGAAGQTSSFGQLLQATGGGNGASISGFLGSGAGGAGGVGTGGTFNFTGTAGTAGSSSPVGGGLGGASSINSPVASALTGHSADGTTAYYSREVKAAGFMDLGFGGGAVSPSSAGQAATGYGNGGGGGCSSSSTTYPGGAGSPGIVIVEW